LKRRLFFVHSQNADFPPFSASNFPANSFHDNCYDELFIIILSRRHQGSMDKVLKASGRIALPKRIYIKK